MADMSLQVQPEIPPDLPADLLQRIYDARYSGKMSDCASDVLSLLVDHPMGPRAGREKAIQISEMQKVWTYAGTHVWVDRHIKGSVKELIEEHFVPIGSSRVAGSSGYFLPVSTEDLEAAERPLRSEIVSLAKRIRTINPNSSFARHIAGQFELSKEEKGK